MSTKHNKQVHGTNDEKQCEEKHKNEYYKMNKTIQKKKKKNRMIIL